jgi:hypothetical protein
VLQQEEVGGGKKKAVSLLAKGLKSVGQKQTWANLLPTVNTGELMRWLPACVLAVSCLASKPLSGSGWRGRCPASPPASCPVGSADS